MVTLEHLRHLQTPAGTRLLSELRGLDPTPATSIAVSTRLRKAYPADLVTAAMTMHRLRVTARAKFSRADAMWFTREGLEQATSETVAQGRQTSVYSENGMANLCCGIGGDLTALDHHAHHPPVVAVDIDPVHLEMARLNAVAYGVDDMVAFQEADVRTTKFKREIGVFIDPARRSPSGRMGVGESEPSLAWCFGLASDGRQVAIKCAPGLPHRLVPEGWGIEAVAVGTDLKEIVLSSPGILEEDRCATVITDSDRSSWFSRPNDGDLELVATRVPEPGDNLLDPNPAVTRAGLVEDLARGLGVERIDPMIAFLIGDRWLGSVFARSLKVVASLPWKERALKARLRELGAGPIDIRRRGLAGDVDAITRRLRGRGDRRFTVAMTRVMDQPWAIVCEEWPVSEQDTSGGFTLDCPPFSSAPNEPGATIDCGIS